MAIKSTLSGEGFLSQEISVEAERPATLAACKKWRRDKFVNIAFSNRFCGTWNVVRGTWNVITGVDIIFVFF